MLAELRTEYQSLSRRLFRGALLTLIILIAATDVFSRAFRDIDGASVIDELRDINGLGARVGATDLGFQSFLGHVAATMYNEHPPDVRPVPPEQREAFQKELADKVAALDAASATWFRVRLGGVDFDLAYWIIAFPIFLWLSSVHLWLQRAKLRVVHALGASRLIAEASPLDRLVFGGAYVRDPARLGTFVYITAVAVLVLCLAAAVSDLWLFLSEYRWAVVVLLFLGSCYAFQIAFSMARRLEADADLIFGRAPRNALYARFERWWNAITAAARRFRRTVTSTGALAVLASALLSLAVDCHGQHYRGYELYTRKDTWWYSGSWLRLLDIPRYAYLALLVTAALTLVLVAVSLVIGRLPFARGLGIVAIGGLIFAVADVAFIYPMSTLVLWADLLRILYLVIPLVIWWRGRHRRRIAYIFAPALLLAPIGLAMAIADRFYGVPLFVAGVTLLAAALSPPPLSEA
ncbi:MAG TPA: hypothetical protein VJ276_03945 [Thermoanaerobaculia bacterium]|nr:hypothetical protein [Thermoanaerobaculia bacterium]